MSTVVRMLSERIALQDLEKFSHIVHTVTYTYVLRISVCYVAWSTVLFISEISRQGQKINPSQLA